MPFIIEKQQQTRQETVVETLRSDVKSLRALPDNRVEVLVALDPDAPAANLVEIETKLRDYEKSVNVRGRQNDGNPWLELAANQPVFDYSRFMDIRRCRVELPDNDCREFMIEINGISDIRNSAFVAISGSMGGDGLPVAEFGRTLTERRDMRIDRLRLLRRTSRETPERDIEQEWPLADFRVSHEKGKSGMETRVFIKTNRQPLTGLSILTSSRNFSRACRLQREQIQDMGQTTWADISTGTFSFISFRDIEQRDLTIRFPETREAAYRLLIAAGDGAPLEISAITGHGPAYQLLFLAAPGQSYSLYFGAEGVRAPVFDAASVLGTLRKSRGGQIVQLSLEAMAPNPNFGGRGGFAGMLNSPLLLGTGLVLVLAVLVWAIISALRRVESHTDDKPEAQ
ncbi:MAG: hypothetical protein BWY83_02773 [bacterium ADurb.Bin478]|nr:MAG: hypothetical protein BWY83_02773 [bacterium ADurb.Bin478]